MLWHTSLIRWPGVVDRDQAQAFLLGYLSGQLGLLIVPDTLFTTWSQPAEKHHKTTASLRGHIISSSMVYFPLNIHSLEEEENESKTKAFHTQTYRRFSEQFSFGLRDYKWLKVVPMKTIHTEVCGVNPCI